VLEKLKEEVYQANMELPKRGLVTYTWGNVSGIDRNSCLLVIKPSGVKYELMTPDDMVVVNLDGQIIEGKYKPSSDTPTHIELYKHFPKIGGIVHTHSTWATTWAQACRPIPCYGTTHADYFYGEIPCARCLTEKEIEEHYEQNTGLAIVETLTKEKFKEANILSVPGIICPYHGPFTWGSNATKAVENAVVLEEISEMAAYTELLNPKSHTAPQYIVDKHYYRKHGANAYYGQS
jgi:L-ribulose-5-phosphate 4-epimerase